MSRHAKIFAALVIGGSSVAMIIAAPPADNTGEGVVTRAQFSQAAAVQFDAADANSDGLWTAAELSKFRQDKLAQREAVLGKIQSDPLRALDTNGNGDISEAEMRAAREAFPAAPTQAALEQRMRDKLQRLQQGRS